MTTSLRQEVLSLYRQILSLSRKWESAIKTADATKAERKYIADEAKKLFRINKYVSIFFTTVQVCNIQLCHFMIGTLRTV